MKAWTVLLSITFLLTVNGCAAPPERDLSTQISKFSGLPNGRDPLNPSEFRSDSEHGDFAKFERLHGLTLKILQLSGGG